MEERNSYSAPLQASGISIQSGSDKFAGCLGELQAILATNMHIAPLPQPRVLSDAKCSKPRML